MFEKTIRAAAVGAILLGALLWGVGKVTGNGSFSSASKGLVFAGVLIGFVPLVLLLGIVVWEKLRGKG